MLTGGDSRRMGTDKAALVIDGRPMAHRVSDALIAAGAVEVIRVGATLDRWPGAGPLGGLASAVAHVADDGRGPAVVVVAACDQPDLDAVVLRRLVAALDSVDQTASVAVAVTPDGRRHPFPSAWRTDAAAQLVALVEGGARRADAAFTLGDVVQVAADPASLRDLDTPDDVARWQPPELRAVDEERAP